MTLIRVFPRQTSMTPKDDFAFVGDPPLFRPEADRVHVSVTFTWDTEEGKRLAAAWAQYYPTKIGGPAFDSEVGEFDSGLYLKPGVTITSRGCSRKCPWCFVPPREGSIRLLNIKPGYILQDNNILATSRKHQEAVYKMLNAQKQRAKLSGGIDARLVDDWVADQFRNLRIEEIFLAADTKGSLRSLKKAVDKLSFLGKNSNKMRSYVMIGFGGETITDAEERLKEVWNIGAMPFSQLYQPPDKRIYYPREWKQLNRNWSRPAIIRTMMKAEL